MVRGPPLAGRRPLPQCEGDDVYEPGGKAPMRFRCRPCRRYFSTRSDTVMRDSTLGYRQWLVAAYLMVTNLEGFTAMKLKNALKVRHKTAWHMAHRIREAWRENGPQLAGEIVEIDETWIGGRARNMHRRRRPLGRNCCGESPSSWGRRTARPRKSGPRSSPKGVGGC